MRGAALAAAAVVGAPAARAAAETAAVPVDPGAAWGSWEGWGTSLAWWGNVLGGREDLADLFFTTRTTTVLGRPLPGLGLTLARYNLGASGTNTLPDGRRMAASPNIPHWKQIEGFWDDPAKQDAPDTWNWSADANQRAAMAAAHQRGARVELFANSPMWWMCGNLNPSGSLLGITDNLAAAYRRHHSIHLAETARHAAEHWGIEFSSVEPFNESISPGWTASGNQEGCHFSTGLQRTVLADLRAELDARGLHATPIAASDETWYDLGTTVWEAYGADTNALVDRVNVHGYQGTGGRRDLLRAAVEADRKPLWNSEYGDGDGSGLQLAQCLSLDLRWLHNTAWAYWQTADASDGWGVLRLDPDAADVTAVETKHYVLAQYTRHIRPGMRILDTGSDTCAAAFDPDAGRLVLTAVNTGDTAADTAFDLSAFAALPAGPVTRWSTDTAADGGDRYTRRTTDRLTGTALRATLPAKSVHTFQLDGVRA